jgi:hypothetical protein
LLNVRRFKSAHREERGEETGEERGWSGSRIEAEIVPSP